MNHKRILNNKTAQGILSFALIIILLVSILTGSILYENNITADSIKEKKFIDEKDIQEKTASATISGRVTGLEKVSGFVIETSSITTITSPDSRIITTRETGTDGITKLTIKQYLSDDNYGVYTYTETGTNSGIFAYKSPDSNIYYYNSQGKRVETSGVIIPGKPDSFYADQIKQALVQNSNSQTQQQNTPNLPLGPAVSTSSATTTKSQGSTYYDKDGKVLPGIPFAGTPYTEIQPTRSDGVIVRMDHTADGHTFTYWRNPSNNVVEYRDTAVPLLSEPKAYQVNINGQWLDLPEKFSTKQEAQAYVKNLRGALDVREQTVSQTVGTTYNVYSLSNQFIGKIIVPPGGDIQAPARLLAQLYGKDYGTYSLPKFKLSSASTGDQIYEAPDLAAAIAKYKDTWGKVPESYIEFKPDQPMTSSRSYSLIIKETGQRITFEAQNDEAANKILNNYQNNAIYLSQTLELKKLPTLQELQQQNPRVPAYILQKELENSFIQSSSKQSQELVAPNIYAMQIGEKEVYYVNNDRYEKKVEAEAAYAKANLAFTTTVTKNYAEAAAKKELLGAHLTGELTPEGYLIAKDATGVSYFMPSVDASGKLYGGGWIRFDVSYQTQQKIGDFDVIRTNDLSGKTLSVTLKENEIQAIIDPNSLKLIQQQTSKGLKVDIAKEGDKNILKIRDKTTGLPTEELTFGKNPKTGPESVNLFNIVYLDPETKRVLSANDIANLRKEGKPIPPPTQEKAEERKRNDNGEWIFSTFFHYTKSEGGEPVRYAEAEIRNINTNKREGYIFEKNGERVVVSDISCTPQDSALCNQAKTAYSQFKTRQFFAEVEAVLTQYRGLGYWATLFFDEDSLLKWRESVDKTFSKLYLGTEYWTSSICSHYIDGAQEGIAYAETPQGLAQIGAHVEAVRTQPIATENGIEFIYKITFNVKNGDFEKDLRAPEEMNINVVLKGQQNVNIFKQDQKVKRGTSFGKSGKDAIVKSSNNLYNVICIKFDKIPEKWKISDKELCNTVQEAKGTPINIGTTSPSTSSPAKKPESEINDF